MRLLGIQPATPTSETCPQCWTSQQVAVCWLQCWAVQVLNSTCGPTFGTAIADQAVVLPQRPKLLPLSACSRGRAFKNLTRRDQTFATDRSTN